MREVPVDRSLLIHLPHAYTLVIRATGHQLVIGTDDYVSDPLFVSMIRPRVEPGTDFPQFDGFISRTTYQVVAIHHEIYEAHVMVVPVESFATHKVIIQVP